MKHKLLIIERGLANNSATIRDEKTSEVLLSITATEDKVRMEAAGLKMESNTDMFTYANHLLGNQYEGFAVKSIVEEKTAIELMAEADSDSAEALKQLEARRAEKFFERGSAFNG